MPHSVSPINSQFEELVTALRNVLGSSGLTSEDIDIQELTQLMANYRSDQDEWSRYAYSDATKQYTRNLVDQGNGKCNLLILVWTPGKGSPVHSHSNAHCLMKILRGQLVETRYEFPSNDTAEYKPRGDMDVISEKVYTENQVAYMSDDLGVHKMWNKGSDYAVSLHLYTPPNIVKNGCYIFDVATGEKTHVRSCDFHSAYGKLLNDGMPMDA